jgi:energy-coupling factor transport system ATP-binding protein
MLGLKRELLLKSPFDLSGGEKRRVAIAGVMAMRPDVIVFDEPTAGLDPQGRDLVLNKIKEYRDRTGALVFIVSHSMEDMAKISDKLLVMSKGEVVAFDDTESVFLKRQMLESIGLNVPQVTRVFSSLAERGIDVDPGIFTVEDGVKALVTALRGGEAND